MLWFAAPGALGLLLPVMAALVLASISAEFIIVFSNAMLPDLVSPERLGRLSGFGWGLGYVGGLISLVLIITAPGLKEALAALPDVPGRQALASLVDYTITRHG